MNSNMNTTQTTAARISHHHRSSEMTTGEAMDERRSRNSSTLIGPPSTEVHTRPRANGTTRFTATNDSTAAVAAATLEKPIAAVTAAVAASRRRRPFLESHYRPSGVEDDCNNNDGNSTDAMADAFSCSLAHIAAAGRKSREMDGSTTTTSSSSHHHAATAAIVGDGAVVVSSSSSGTTQSSSGEDRDSSGGGGGGMKRGGSSCETVYELSAAAAATLNTAASLEDRYNHERPHYHRHRRHSSVKHEPSPPAEGGDGADGTMVGPSSAIIASKSSLVVEPTTVVAVHRMPVGGSSSADLVAVAYSSSGGDSDRAVKEEGASSSLLQPYREPCFHKIRQTFYKFSNKRSSSSRKSSKRENSLGDEKDAALPVHKRTKRGIKRQLAPAANAVFASSKKRSVEGWDLDDSDSMEDESGLSSGSGTEGGYGASNSSNSNVAQSGSSSSPSSEDSSEDSGSERKRSKWQSSGDPTRLMLSKKRDSALSLSSEIADFSSSVKTQSESPSLSSSSNEEESRLVKQGVQELRSPDWSLVPWQVPTSMVAKERDGRWMKKRVRLGERKPLTVSNLLTERPTLEGKPPIMALGCDVMAHVLTFLEPPDILDVLTVPISKDWLNMFTRQPELWRVLCLLEPFKAQVDDEGEGCDSDSSDDDSVDSFQFDSKSTAKKSKFRLLYTSYVRCMRCLIRIKDDAVNGRPLSVVDYSSVLGRGASTYNVGANHNLQQFLSRARGCVAPALVQMINVEQVASDSPIDACDKEENVARNPTAVSTTTRRISNMDRAFASPKKRKIKFAHSKLTKRLIGPESDIGEVELPWSCGIYSIVNWMAAFSDVEGIQTMCLRVLPFLLENEQQRITAQRAGLTDIVLRGMVLFPESAMLHTASFHTIVLLARPLGGQEGMLFHTSMVNSSGIFSSTDQGAPGGKSGIAVLLDSMRRFQSDEVLQSMACWSLVNIALAPAQKEVLVKLGGIEVIAEAMTEHQYNAEVQFRALFALINLVIPSVSGANREQALPDADSSEKEMLDDMVDQIVNLVVLSMKNFCSNEAILNRACLVLHNLSLTQSYHCAMLWTPNCYQMLEWCLGNYRTDQVLQQSAAGTLHRLQMTLGSDETLRSRFAMSIQAQQKQSLEQAHQEAMRLHEQHEKRAAQELELMDVSNGGL